MANPQIENGYVRISNEIWNEIIRRDFKKRQIAILQFILRLSYGCRQKSAIVPKLKDFELCGVGRNHIREELEYLEKCRVIRWDREQMFFTIIKDYEMWQVSPVKGWDEEEFKRLIHLNIGNKSSQNRNQIIPESGTLAEESSQNRNLEVPETGTEEFPKQELGEDSIPCDSRVEDVPKDIIKDIIKDNVVVVDELKNPQQVSRHVYRQTVAGKYVSLRAKGTELSALDDGVITELMAKQIPMSTVLEGIEQAFTSFKPKHSLDRINSLSYCLPIIMTLDARKTALSNNDYAFERMTDSPIRSPSESGQDPPTAEEDLEYQELLAQMKSCSTG
jgi:phage replication O-like protein O